MFWHLIVWILSWIFWLAYGFIIGKAFEQSKNERENAEKLNNNKSKMKPTMNDCRNNSKDNDLNYLNEMIEILRNMIKTSVTNRSIIVGDSEYIIINCELDCLVDKRDKLKRNYKRNNLNVNGIYKNKHLFIHTVSLTSNANDCLPNKRTKR